MVFSVETTRLVTILVLQALCTLAGFAIGWKAKEEYDETD